MATASDDAKALLFREEVAALARKDGRKKPDAVISPHRWKIAAHKHYVLVEK